METPPSPNKSDAGHPRTLWRNAVWAIRELWSSSPSLTIGLAVVTLCRGAVPVGLALFARGLIDAFVVGQKEDGQLAVVAPWLLLGFGLTIVEAVAPLAFQFVIRRLSDDINLNISTKILTHASKLELEFFENPDRRQTIELAQQNAAERFSRFVQELVGTTTSTLQAVSLLAILVVIEPLVLAIVAPCGLVYLIFKWRLSKQHYKKACDRTPRRRWTTYFVSCLMNWNSVAEVKLLGLADVLVQRFHRLMKQFCDEDRKLHQRSFSGATLFAVLTTCAFYGVFIGLLVKAFRGGATVGDIAIFGPVTSRLRLTLEMCIASLAQALEQTLYIDNLTSFLAVVPRSGPTPGIVPRAGRGEIELDNVTFTYPGAADPTLQQISLHIRPGEIIGIAGETGAGKTTLVKLLCRLYDADMGCVRFDGIDVRDLSLDYLHRQIGFLMQGFGRYETTAAENIAYGDWQRLLEDREAVERIAQSANVDDLVQSLPQSYDTMLGRMFGTVDLSGGQWQRLALARAFARDASLMILDEPTSNLDARAEYRLFRQFRELANGRTTILISHRFSTLRMADRIVVLESGRLVECGTHQELLDRRGTYAGLYDLHRSQIDGGNGRAEMIGHDAL